MSTSAQADDFEPDFVFDFMACKTIGAPLGAPGKDGPFKETTPAGHQTMCARKGKKRVDCITIFEEKGAKPVQYELRITAEFAELLILESESGGDYLTAKPSTGGAVSTTRMVGENYLAMKVCHGFYMTGDEFRAMAARRMKEKGAK